MTKRDSLFQLLRWPIDICAFGLALSYGVNRLLHTAYRPDPVPFWPLFAAFVIVTFVSVCIVRTYMPSDERLEEIKIAGVVVIMWINVSILLSTAVPILGVLYSDTLLFWFVMVIAGLGKALHSLEERKRKTSSEREHKATESRSSWDAFFFLPKPDAYALGVFPTAILTTAMSTGFVLIIGTWKGLAPWSWFFGLGLLGGSSCLYSHLSGVARKKANSRGKSA